MDNFLKQDEHNKQRKIIYKYLHNIDLYLKKSPSIETIHHAPGTLNSRPFLSPQLLSWSSALLIASIDLWSPWSVFQLIDRLWHYLQTPPLIVCQTFSHLSNLAQFIAPVYRNESIETSRQVNSENVNLNFCSWDDCDSCHQKYRVSVSHENLMWTREVSSLEFKI